MKNLFLSIALVLFASTSFASASSGPISEWYFMSNGVVLVYSSGVRTGTQPSCVTSPSNRFAFDATTPAGKAQLAGILAAYASGKIVEIVGAGNCSAYSDSESLSFFHVTDS